MAFLSSPSPSSSPNINHSRNKSFSPNGPSSVSTHLVPPASIHRSNSKSSGTFAPRFIEAEEAQHDTERIRGIEGENDFSGKRYVWLRDAKLAFVRGWVVEERAGGNLLVQCDDDTQREVEADSVDKVNPAKFDKAGDMAELTHLNEASVVHNLHMRYQADLIYTYSGLFLVTVNPYCPLPIYGNDYMKMYKGRSREETKPHIFAIADEAFRNLIEEGENQSILVTGESGAGKTENTKKVIQYLAAAATSNTPGLRSGARQINNLSAQILRANPILEAFGNAQTVRNNNSSRFGKFIRIEFLRSGQIAGAYIDWYLLEKSRVVRVNSSERNYHVFYQLLNGADPSLKSRLLLNGMNVEHFRYTRDGNDVISGVSDVDEWSALIEAFHVMGFSEEDQMAILRTVASVLHLGNLAIAKESTRGDQASLGQDGYAQVDRICQLLGIDAEAFIKGLLHPVVKAGREWVEKVQTPEQVRAAVDSLAKGIYERAFGDLVTRINHQLDRHGFSADDSHFIGVLDIAGFEIFEHNSFEQLAINYTNEKLQQFFNHHMFVLEQEEYAREQIEWKFIDFGKDLQPTIDLIEVTNPIGIFSCLDEESVMPRATDKTFTEKLHGLWEKKTTKYRPSRLSQGFVLTHYASEVEYSTEGWLEKNKDPLNDNVTRLLAGSSHKHIAALFADCADVDDEAGPNRSRVKKGLFRTVAQRHKEQLSNLMGSLHSTHPHFVRCILPNHKKKPKQWNAPLVLDQLRCNGVLEGIRIARTGFPNRLPFAEFRSRYEVLCKSMPTGYIEGQAACRLILEKLNLDKAVYRIGLSKVFFRAGVLAELEEQRDALINEIMGRFQSIARGYVQRRAAHKRLYRAEATRVIQRNFQIYLDLARNPWWKLFVRMRPLLGATRTANEVKKRDEMIQALQNKMQQNGQDRQKLEDDRRKAELEIQRVQQVLEGERALALDKEEIFKRLQDREAELEEKLAGAIEDQEQLEDQLDDLLDAKKRAESEANNWRTKVEQAGMVIQKMEAERAELIAQVQELEAKISNIVQSESHNSAQVETLLQEKRMLESQLSLQQRKVSDLETKLLKTDQDLDVKFAAATKEVQASKRQNKELADETENLRRQLKDLSSTSTTFEDMIRKKDSELSLLRSDQRKLEAERKSLENEKGSLATRHDSMQGRLRQVQAESDALKAQQSQLERQAADAKKILEDKMTEDVQSGNNRRMLEAQIKDLKEQAFRAEEDLSRERQSRDDVRMLSEHQLAQLQEEYDSLNEAKIEIEKEMYLQTDQLRRATEARNSAEWNQKELQAELKKLRERYTAAEDSRIQAESAAEKALSKQAQERQARLQREVNEKSADLDQAMSERDRLAKEVQDLIAEMADSDNFRMLNDQHKERLEREVVTIKGRLTASENDNRVLLNKLQQKNLDIARSNSRAGDSQRARESQLVKDKSKLEDDKKRLSQQLGDAQVKVTSLEKQKEKLELDLEDTVHEAERHQKALRTAETNNSSITATLAEVRRNLDSEKQQNVQSQDNYKKLSDMMAIANQEVEECRRQLIILQKVFDPEVTEAAVKAEREATWEAIQPRLQESIDLAQQLDEAQMALQVTHEKWVRSEKQLTETRRRHEEDIADLEAKHSGSKKNFLEELNQNTLNSPRSPPRQRKMSDLNKTWSTMNTPDRKQLRRVNDENMDSVRSDRTIDSVSQNRKADQAAEIEMLQNQLQMVEMQNRHLRSQLERQTAPTNGHDDSPSARRVQRLQQENSKLNGKLDDSARKMSVLERNLQRGELSLRDVQSKSHEELFEVLHSQESGRRELMQQQTGLISELEDVRARESGLHSDNTEIATALREAREELQELHMSNEHELANRAQLLQDFADLQIRFDAEASKLADVSSSLSLYKSRADEYFNKLEQAEITVIKASRAEQFAKQQAKEADETYATVMAERQQMEAAIEDLQRQTQGYEEKVEDLSADLDAATQAKRRLQHELEDYRSQRAIDVEDKETSLEQTRKKYQSEFAHLSNELDVEREHVIQARAENTHLRDELEELRAKWDDEVLNSSTWAKEKSRLELTVQDLSAAREEAVDAHNDAQSKIVSLLSQVRSLRTSSDDVSAERDQLIKEKRGLEARLAEAGDRLDDLAQQGESPSKRNAAGMDKEILELKSHLAQQQDIAEAAIDKMRRSDAMAVEMQKDVVAEREKTVELHKEKAALEKNLTELQGRVVSLETKGYSSASHDVRFLTGRVKEVS